MYKKCSIVLVGDDDSERNSIMKRYKTENLSSYSDDAGILSREFIDGEDVYIKITSTPYRDADKLRLVLYSKADVIVLCYSVNKVSSYDNCKLLWLNEIKKMKEKVPIVIVANNMEQMDQTTLKNMEKIGRDFTEEVKASAFFPVSHRTGEGIVEMIQEAARLATMRSKSNTSCLIS